MAARLARARPAADRLPRVGRFQPGVAGPGSRATCGTRARSASGQSVQSSTPAARCVRSNSATGRSRRGTRTAGRRLERAGPLVDGAAGARGLEGPVDRSGGGVPLGNDRTREIIAACRPGCCAASSRPARRSPGRRPTSADWALRAVSERPAGRRPRDGPADEQLRQAGVLRHLRRDRPVAAGEKRRGRDSRQRPLLRPAGQAAGGDADLRLSQAAAATPHRVRRRQQRPAFGATSSGRSPTGGRSAPTASSTARSTTPGWSKTAGTRLVSTTRNGSRPTWSRRPAASWWPR